MLYAAMLLHVGDFFRRATRRCASLSAGQPLVLSQLAAARQVEHLLDCIARIARCLWGRSALTDEKMSFSVPLGILGLRVDLSAGGVACAPLPDNIAKLTSRIQAALVSGELLAGAGSFPSLFKVAARAARGRRGTGGLSVLGRGLTRSIARGGR